MKLNIQEAFALMRDMLLVIMKRHNIPSQSITIDDLSEVTEKHALILDEHSTGYTVTVGKAIKKQKHKRAGGSDMLFVTQDMLEKNRHDQAMWVAFNIFIKLYDGDADKWMEWLRKEGSNEQVAECFPIAIKLKQEAAKDPTLIKRIREAVGS